MLLFAILLALQSIKKATLMVVRRTLFFPCVSMEEGGSNCRV